MSLFTHVDTFLRGEAAGTRQRGSGLERHLAGAAQSGAIRGFLGELIFYGNKDKKVGKPILVEGTLVVYAFD